MNTGELWFVKNSDSTDPLVTRAEITYLKGNVIGLSYNNYAPDYYDLRLLDFVGRDYEQEEKRAQERFLEQIRVHDDTPFKENMLGSFDGVPEEVVPPNPTKPSWWTRLKIWWITRVA